MSDGFVSWCQAEWSHETAPAMVADFEGKGWSLSNPSDGEVYTLDDSGRVIVPRAELIERLSSIVPEGFMVQWWLEGSTDVWHILEPQPGGGVMHEFSLDGVGEYRSKIVQDVLALALDQEHSTNAVIVDHYGGSQEVPWDAIVAGDGIAIDVMPDLLGLPRDIDARHPEIAGYEPIRTVGDLVIRDPEGILQGSAD